MENVTYKLLADRDGNVYGASCSNGWSFVFDPANKDYTAYLEWIAAGNTPLPANEEAK